MTKASLTEMQATASTPLDLSSPALRTKLGEVRLGAGGREGAGGGEEDGSLALGEVGDGEVSGGEVVQGVEVGEGGVGKVVADRYGGGGGGEARAEEEEGGGDG